MADTITDNRTLLSANNAGDTAPDDLAGSADTASDTSTFINGTSSRPFKVSQAVDGRLYDAGTAQNWANNTFYLWYLSTSVADTFANGGVRIRFCGATVTDYFEKHVDGGNSKGWSMAVVDIEQARADAVGAVDGGTGGTAPATTAIRYVGVVFDIPGMISGNTDNCFVNGFWRLPSATAGIIVQGRNGGSTDWDWDDIATTGDINDTTKAWGTISKEDGIFTINTPIQFGFNDTSTHGFTDTNQVIAWQDNLVDADFYGFTILGNSGGTTNWTAGIKTGSGDSATGAQGWVITAASTGQRWFFDANDANVDAIGIFGCSLIHSAGLSFDSSLVEVRNNLINDGTSALLSNCVFQKNTIINANTADDESWATTDDLGDLKLNVFEFSDGHAIEILSGGSATQSSSNSFIGYGAIASTDAALFNDFGTDLTISITSPGTVAQHTYINGTSATTTLSQDVQTTLTGLRDNTEIRIMAAGTDTELDGIEAATTGSTDDRSFAFTLSASTSIDIFMVNVIYENIELYAYEVTASDTALPQVQRFDRVYLNP